MSNRLPVPLLHSLLLAALIFIIYRPTLNFNFVWDDFLFVEQNTAIQSWAYLDDAFTSPQTTWSSDPNHTLPAWRPIRNISFLIDHTLYGLNPTGWHLTNVILHAIAAILLYFLIRRLITLAAHPADPPATTNTAALIGALYWALHPLQTEVVAWVKSRDDLLAATFFIATLLTALPRKTTNPQPSTPNSPLRYPFSVLRYPIPLLLFITALLSKENTIILAALYPAILLLLSAPPRLRASALKKSQNPTTKPNTVPHQPSTATYSTTNSPQPTQPSTPNSQTDPPATQLSSLPISFAPLRLCVMQFLLPVLFILTALIFLITRHLILGRTSQVDPLAPNPLSMLLTMLAAFTRYIQLILWPWPPTVQSADYDAFPIITNPLHPTALTGAAILLALLLLLFVTSCLCVKKSSRLPLIAISVATFLLALLPFANIIPMMQILAERFLYLPLIGPAILLSSLLVTFAPLRLCVMHFLLSTPLILALAIQTHHRLPVWQNDIALFSSTLRANPHSWRPPNNLAKALLKYGQTTAALHTITPAIQQFPRDPDIIRTAATAHLLAGHETTGTQLIHYATQLQPNDPRATAILTQYYQLKANGQLPTP